MIFKQCTQVQNVTQLLRLFRGNPDRYVYLVRQLRHSMLKWGPTEALLMIAMSHHCLSRALSLLLKDVLKCNFTEMHSTGSFYGESAPQYSSLGLPQPHKAIS